MGKKTYKFLGLLDGSRIILGDKRAFRKDKESYDQLAEELQDDWDQMQAAKSTERRTELRIGDHAVVKSLKCKNLQRAIVLDINGVNTSLQNRSYSVFLYDEGDFDDIDEHRIMLLSQVRRQQLTPRSVVVRLTGIVPAKIVPDLAKKALNPQDDSAFIVTQDSSWTPRTNRSVEEWLKHPDVKYLGFDTTKTNEDGSVFGDVYRKLKSRVGGPSTAVTIDDEIDEGNPEKKQKYSLCDYILEKKFALYNADLANSQLKVRRQENRQQTNDVENGKDTSPPLLDYDELATTRQSFPQVPFASTSASANRKTKEIADSASTKRSVQGRTSIADEPKINKLAGDIKLLGNESLSMSKSTASSLTEGNSLPTGQLINTLKDSGINCRINIPGKLLVRGKMVRPPYKKTEEFQLNSNIVKALETLQINELSDMHKIVAPNFIRGSDLIVIATDGGNQHGKNIRVLSYILPILRLVYDKYGDDISEIADGEPPEAVIVVNSFNTGINLENYINQLLNFSQELPMRVKFLSKDTETTQKHNYSYRKKLIPGGIVIMILTMSYLSKVMQTVEGPRLFEGLRFLIFEELDMYLRKDKEDMLTFIEAARTNMKISVTSLPFQITFSGSKWSAEMEDLYKEMVKDRAPMVTIAAPNQVLRYAKIKWKVHYLPEEETRIQKFNDVLEENCLKTHKRIVIACSNSLIANQVYESITAHDGQQTLLIFSGMDNNALIHTMNAWRKNGINVIIVSDDMMNKVDITDATCLFCYDSPEILIQSGFRRPLAAERFGYLWSNIRHIESEHATLNGSSPESQELIAHFLMTGNEYNFYQMYKFGNSLEADVEFPIELKQCAAILEQAGKVDMQMCQGIKFFGFCNHADPEICPSRHFFLRDELTSHPNVPLTGEVEVRIIKCENPSSYQAELLRHFIFENGKRVCNHSYINDAHRRLFQLKKYFGSGEKDEENVERLKAFDEGIWCAVKVRDPDQDYFARAKVGKVIQRDKYDQPITVRVYCVDSGLILNPAVDQLYVLPEEFQKWSPLVVNLILCNLKPGRGELEYRQQLIKRARNITTDHIYNAKIWLSIENTIWVNPMVEYHMDSITKRPYRGDSVRMILINEKIAEFSRLHLETLMSLVNKYPGLYQGITSTKELNESSDEMLLAKQEFHQIGDEIQWAFVGKSKRNKFDPAKIVTQYGYDPWLFFGVHDKYYSEMKCLEQELHTCVEKYIDGTEEDSRFINHTNLFTNNFYEVGMIVAARERIDQTWMRGLIMQKRKVEYEGDGAGDKEVYTEFEVYFVDYGDTCFNMTVDEMFPIPHKFVSRMPFQAIAFKLNHIEPLENAQKGWSESEKCAFLDIIVKNQLSIDVELVAIDDVYDSSSNPIPCRYYNAIAIFKDNELGSLLIEQGAAKLKPGNEDIVKEFENKFLNFYNVAVDQALASDDEEASDANDEFLEEFDINFSGSDALNMLGIKNNGVVFPDLVGVGNSRGDFMMQQPALPPASAPEASPAVNSTVSLEVLPKPVAKKPKEGSKDPTLKDELLHPKVYWRQTDSAFILTLQLPDIKEFELKVLDDKSTIDFKTLDKSPNYGFKIKVFGKLNSEFSTHLTGQYMRSTFTKRMVDVSWIRPLFSKTEKFQWLKEDLDYIQDEEETPDDDEKDKDIIKQSIAKSTVKEDDIADELEDVDFDNYADSSDTFDDDDD